ncbi:MAG TPA: hypothetical protein PLP19_22325 [bacterium]|nr:hypothetical protein [bacterium]HPN46238.1 hypothetical protein [bacterium]
MLEKIEKTKLLLVEGKDELNFFNKLLQLIEVIEVQTINVEGKDNFKNKMHALYNQEGFNKVIRLGFIRDAEMEKANSAFDSICSILKSFNLPEPNQSNNITKNTYPTIGIYIVPDNSGAGMLENLCLKTIERQKKYICVEQFIKCCENYLTDEEKKIYNAPKAHVQSYLASCVPIANNLGIGALRGHWDFNHEALNDIKHFLQSLFQ